MLTTLELCLESYGVIHISDASRVLGIPIRPLLIYGEAPHDVSVIYGVLVVVFVYYCLFISIENGDQVIYCIFFCCQIDSG